MTDNKNRTVAEVRKIFTRHGGNMGEAGCVAWMFSKKGYIVVERSKADEDSLMSIALDAGALDMKSDNSNFEIITEPKDLEKVKEALKQKNIEMTVAEATMVPQNYIKLEGKGAEQMLKLMDELEDHDDVQNVYANFDIPEEIIAKG